MVEEFTTAIFRYIPIDRWNLIMECSYFLTGFVPIRAKSCITLELYVLIQGYGPQPRYEIPIALLH